VEAEQVWKAIEASIRTFRTRFVNRSEAGNDDLTTLTVVEPLNPTRQATSEMGPPKFHNCNVRATCQFWDTSQSRPLLLSKQNVKLEGIEKTSMEGIEGWTT
jgi:hypothetical protein